MGCCQSKDADTEEDSKATPVIPQLKTVDKAPDALPEHVIVETSLSGNENVCPYAANSKHNTPNEVTPVQTARVCPESMVDEGKVENGNETSDNIEIQPEETVDNPLITDDDNVFSEINVAREVIRKYNEDILSTDERIDAFIGDKSPPNTLESDKEDTERSNNT